MEPKYSVDDLVHFFDDDEVGVVQSVMPKKGSYYYCVKFGETVDQNWPGFVYPENLILPVSSSEADPAGTQPAGSGA